MACNSAHAITTQQNNHLRPIVGLWSQCKYTTDLFRTTFMTELLKPICIIIARNKQQKANERTAQRERERQRERDREREREREIYR